MNYKKTVFGLCVIFIFAVTSTSFAAYKYMEGTVSNGGSISGKIIFKGAAPEAIMEDLHKGKNVVRWIRPREWRIGKSMG